MDAAFLAMAESVEPNAQEDCVRVIAWIAASIAIALLLVVAYMSVRLLAGLFLFGLIFSITSRPLRSNQHRYRRRPFHRDVFKSRRV